MTKTKVSSCLFPLGSEREDFNFLCKYRITLNNIADLILSFYSKQREAGKAPNINMLCGLVGDASAKMR